MAVRGIAAEAEARGLRRRTGAARCSRSARRCRSTRARACATCWRRDVDVAHALYAGDDTTDLDAFRGLAELVAEGRLQTAVRVGVRSDEGPPEIEHEADLLVDGPGGVHRLLESLLRP